MLVLGRPDSGFEVRHLEVEIARGRRVPNQRQMAGQVLVIESNDVVVGQSIAEDFSNVSVHDVEVTPAEEVIAAQQIVKDFSKRQSKVAQLVSVGDTNHVTETRRRTFDELFKRQAEHAYVARQLYGCFTVCDEQPVDAGVPVAGFKKKRHPLGPRAEVKDKDQDARHRGRG